LLLGQLQRVKAGSEECRAVQVGRFCGVDFVGQTSVATRHCETGSGVGFDRGIRCSGTLAGKVFEQAAGRTADPSTTLRSGRDDNSVVAGIDATEQCPTSATELSSRPERSVVEGSAVSPHPTHNSHLSHLSPLVIPTGAKRSGGICSAPCGSLQSFREGSRRNESPINPTESTNQLIWTALTLNSSGDRRWRQRRHEEFRITEQKLPR